MGAEVQACYSVLEEQLTLRSPHIPKQGELEFRSFKTILVLQLIRRRRPGQGFLCFPFALNLFNKFHQR